MKNPFKGWFKSRKPQQIMDDNIKYLETNTYFNSYPDIRYYIDTLHESVFLLTKVERWKYYMVKLRNIFVALNRSMDKSGQLFYEIEYMRLQDIKNELNRLM